MCSAGCGPALPEAVRCTQVVELFDASSRLVEFADTTGDGVPEAWILEGGSLETIADGLSRHDDGRFVSSLHVEVVGDFRGFADVNGDGREDLVVEPMLDTEGSAWRVHGSDANGVPSEVIEDVYFGALQEWGLDYVDVDGDDRADLVGATVDSVFIDVAAGGRVNSQGADIRTNNARVLRIDTGWLLVTNGDYDDPWLDILELAGSELELRFRGPLPSAHGFVEAVARSSDDVVSWFSATRRGELIDLVRVDIDVDAGTTAEVAVAEAATRGRAADLDGDTYMDVAWIDAETAELRARFGRNDGELGGTQAFPEVGALEFLDDTVDLEGSGASQLVLRHDVGEELHRFEAIAVDGCGAP